MNYDLNHPNFSICPSCGTINYDPKLSLTELSKPAPCCGAKDEVRLKWPSLPVLKYFEDIPQQETTSEEGLRRSIISLSEVLELLFEDVLWKLLELHTKSVTHAEKMLESNSGRDRRIILYDSLSDRKISELLNSTEDNLFLERWDKLARLQNLIIHEKYSIDKTEAIEIVELIRDGALEIFVKIENDVLRQKKSRSV